LNEEDDRAVRAQLARVNLKEAGREDILRAIGEVNLPCLPPPK